MELYQSLRSDFRIELSSIVVVSAPNIEDLSNHMENIYQHEKLVVNNYNNQPKKIVVW